MYSPSANDMYTALGQYLQHIYTDLGDEMMNDDEDDVPRYWTSRLQDVGPPPLLPPGGRTVWAATMGPRLLRSPAISDMSLR